MWGAIIGAIADVAANAIGSSIANKRKAEAEEAYQNAVNEQIDDVNEQINSNYLDSAEARNAIRKVTDSNTESLRQLNTEAIRGGATDEAKVAMANKLTKNTADVVGDLAAIGERRKVALRGEKRRLQLGLAQHQYSQDADTSGITSLLSSIGSAANTLGGAIDSKGTSPVSTTEEESTPSKSSSDPNITYTKNGNLQDTTNEQYYYGKNGIVL